MRKIILFMAALTALTSYTIKNEKTLPQAVAEAQNKEVIQLPEINGNRGESVMQALQNRRSYRGGIATNDILLQDLGDLLWAANGYNRPDKRTNATGKNTQAIEIYVCTASGAYFYNAKEHCLNRVSDQDLRPQVANGQQFVETVPVSLVVTANLVNPLYEQEVWRSMSGIDAGIVSSNIYLFCSANNLATICRTTMDKEALAQALHMTEKHVIHLNHPVGYPAE